MAGLDHFSGDHVTMDWPVFAPSRQGGKNRHHYLRYFLARALFTARAGEQRGCKIVIL